MRNIRNPKPQTWIARACVNGVQRHVGTFRTHAQAVHARDQAARKQPKVAPRSASAIAKNEKPSKGITEEFTSLGWRYDVSRYIRGYYCYGGRHATMEAAGKASDELRLTPEQIEFLEREDTPRSERGITVRFNIARNLEHCRDPNKEPPSASFTARTYKGARRNLGTFKTLEEAREAVRRADAEAQGCE